LKLIEFSNEKKLIFEFFNKQKESNPENPTLGFYFSILNELCPNNSLFYDGERPDVANDEEENNPVKQKDNGSDQNKQNSAPLNVSFSHPTI
jgi:hypothetical protein